MPATGSSFVRAEHYLDVGNPQACLDLLNEVAFDEDPVRAFGLRSLALLRLGRNEEALEVAEAGLAHEESPALLFYAAQASESMRRPETGTYFRRAVEASPYDVAIVCRYGSFLIDANHLDEAHRMAATAEQLDPTSTNRLVLEGEIARAEEDWPRCRSYAQAVLADDPENVQALVLMAVSADAQGDFDGGARRLGQAAAANPQDRGLRKAARRAQAAAAPALRPVRLASEALPWWAQGLILVITFRIARQLPAPANLILGTLVLSWVAYSWIATGYVAFRGRRSRR
ncbi:hypothetical protein CLV56_3524 [Mumia flava]|uniref:Tetratricopeptide repeat protein n=1 Tax=Mumia flava TaxID=1348852 RepID=A0A0B2BKS1_9ACTN|nr:hypothetical protein [Mumia flava]PJJ54021.1 hypothetical protein CLV56_3524 [Mumia flava]